MRIDVRGSEELRDVVLAINQSDREIQRVIRTYTKSELSRPWVDAIRERASSRVEDRVISNTSVVSVSNQNIRIQSASKGRKLSGGLNPRTDYGPVEFGAGHQKKSYVRKGHRVTRNTTAQFKGTNRKGYVFYPAAREMIPRLASLWVQTVVKTYAMIFEGKG